jgi:hypothetical protein
MVFLRMATSIPPQRKSSSLQWKIEQRIGSWIKTGLDRKGKPHVFIRLE